MLLVVIIFMSEVSEETISSSGPFVCGPFVCGDMSLIPLSSFLPGLIFSQLRLLCLAFSVCPLGLVCRQGCFCTDVAGVFLCDRLYRCNTCWGRLCIKYSLGTGAITFGWEKCFHT